MISLILKIKKYGLKRSYRFLKTFSRQKINTLSGKESYSQYGEDLIISKLLKNKTGGFYVDVGAFSPEKLSNTKYFSLRGWRGINLDVNPKTISEFKLARPNDISLNIGISDTESTMTFYKIRGMNSYMANTFVDSVDQKENVQEEVTVKVLPLAKVLEEFLGSNTIDFMSIDVEGYDLLAIKSNNWQKFRPQIVCVESFCESDDKMYEKQKEFMKSVGYKEVYNNGLNSFYKNAAE